MRRVGIVILAVSALLALTPAAPASADGEKGGVSKDGDGVGLWDQVGRDTSGTPGSGNSRQASYDPDAYMCRYVRQVNSGNYEYVAPRPGGSTGGQSMNYICGRAAEVLAAMGQADPARYFMGNCQGGPYGCAATYGRWVENAAPTPSEVAQMLRKRMNLSPPAELHTSPDSDRLYVRFPTWFWFTGGSVEATSETLGPIRAVAKPTFVWNTGEGTVTCPGSGTPYVAGSYPAGAESPTCGHTYRRPGRYTLTLTVTWTFTWYENGVPGDPAVLPPTVYYAQQDIAVNEIQGIVTDVR